jgi:hypothetical protein
MKWLVVIIIIERMKKPSYMDFTTLLAGSSFKLQNYEGIDWFIATNPSSTPRLIVLSIIIIMERLQAMRTSSLLHLI